VAKLKNNSPLLNSKDQSVLSYFLNAKQRLLGARFVNINPEFNKPFGICSTLEHCISAINQSQ
jgi:hypothetical protein